MAKILVVDDDVEVGGSLRELLTALGHEAYWTGDGIGAGVQSQSLKPNLIILDFSLPGADGATVYRRLRGSPATKDTPILLISAHPTQLIDQAFKAQGIQSLEGVRFLEKPFERAAFEAALDELLRFQAP